MYKIDIAVQRLLKPKMAIWERTFNIPPMRLGLLVSMFFLIFVNSCAETDHRSRILQMIASAAEQAEENHVSGVLDHTVGTFKAQPGNHDRRSVRGILWWAFRHYGKLSVLYPQPSVTIDPDSETAAVELYFLIVKKEGKVPDLKELAKDPQQWLRTVGENADLFQLQLELILIDDQWKASTAHLAPYAPGGF